MGSAHVDAQVQHPEGSDEDVMWSDTSSNMVTMVHSLRVMPDTLEGEVLPTGLVRILSFVLVFPRWLVGRFSFHLVTHRVSFRNCGIAVWLSLMS